MESLDPSQSPSHPMVKIPALALEFRVEQAQKLKGKNSLKSSAVPKLQESFQTEYLSAFKLLSHIIQNKAWERQNNS